MNKWRRKIDTGLWTFSSFLFLLQLQIEIEFVVEVVADDDQMKCTNIIFIYDNSQSIGWKKKKTP